MRRLQFTVVAILALILGVTSVAVASSQFKQTAKIAFTVKKEGDSTGFKVKIKSSDPGAPNAQPQALKQLTVVFPQRTRFNFKSKAMKQCKATDTEIKATGGAACPTKSRVGKGNAVANGAPVLPMIPENVTAFAAGNKVVKLLLAPASTAGQTLVIRAKVKNNTLKANVPTIEAGGLKIVITELNLKVKAIGHDRSAFVTAGKCSSKKFVVKSKFLYETGQKLTLKSTSKCSR